MIDDDLLDRHSTRLELKPEAFDALKNGFVGFRCG